MLDHASRASSLHRAPWRARSLLGPMIVLGVVVLLIGLAAPHPLRAQSGDAPSPVAAPVKSAQADTSLRQAPNSRVAMVLPPAFQPARLYSGFEDERNGISFVIFEAPAAAFDEMRTAFTPESLAARGLTDGRAGRLKRNDEHIYMQARQSSPAGIYSKFFVLFRTGDQTVLVTANVPERALETHATNAETIESALASAVTVAVTDIKELYRFGYLGPFKEAGRVAGTSKLYTPDGRLEPERKGLSRPALIVAPSIDKRPVGDVATTAKALLQTLAGYRDISIGIPEPVTVSGLKGVSLQGEAKDAQSGAEIVIHQVLLVAHDGGYYRLVGLVPKADAERLLPELQRITQSFQILGG